MGNSQAVQWLGLRAFNAMAPDSIPGQGTKIRQVSQCSRKKKKSPNDSDTGHPQIHSENCCPATVILDHDCTKIIWEAFKYPRCQVPPSACSGVEPNTSSQSNV